MPQDSSAKKILQHLLDARVKMLGLHDPLYVPGLLPNGMMPPTKNDFVEALDELIAAFKVCYKPQASQQDEPDQSSINPLQEMPDLVFDPPQSLPGKDTSDTELLPSPPNILPKA